MTPIKIIIPIFVLSLGLAAGLMFNIQPMIGKMLLPLVGGAPAVWNVAMAYFQLMLLGGYLLAYLLSRLSPLQHGVGYLIILTLSFLTLPIALPDGWYPAPGQTLPFQVLQALFLSTGLPFLALSLSAPTLQRLFAASGHARAEDPYFLYAASNLGSFIGLFAYPLWLEPAFTLGQQTELWRWLNLGLIGLVMLSLALTRFSRAGRNATHEPAPATSGTDASPRWSEKAQWMALAAIPSSLLLGATTYISTDISALPLLWAVVLGFYLLTFIIAFHPPRWLNGRAVQAWHVALVIAVLLFPLLRTWFPSLAAEVPTMAVVTLVLLAFGAAALVCHQRLAAMRPAPRHLTNYYLWLSIGGAVGGSITAFLVPMIFTGAPELVLGLFLSLAFNQRPEWSASRGRILALTGLTALLFLFSLKLPLSAARWPDFQAGWHAVGFQAVVMVCILVATVRRYVLISLVIGIGAYTLLLLDGGFVFAERNFFGVARVVDINKIQADGMPIIHRILQHGTTRHGLQVSTPAGRINVPNAYFSAQGPFGPVLSDSRFKRVAVIGLGAGNMNCFDAPGRRFHFFEIDPAVVKIAQEQFTFLSACPQADITLGDGRLMLKADTSGAYDIVVLDAFSSDFIPIHLLTMEAIKVYLDHLAPDGVILMHVSNRAFQLAPVLASTANALGLHAAGAEQPVVPEPDVNYPSEWVALARRPELLSPYIGQNHWAWLNPEPGRRPWTDDYSNLLSTLKR